MGEVLMGGTAALLLCVFLSPRFIEFMRERQFGQHIREEGPEHHQTKAGTPTMGGLIIFIAISVPFLILTDGDWRAVGVFGTALACAAVGFADDYTKIVRRRSLGLQGRTKLILLVLISFALWWVAKEQADISTSVRLRFVDASVDVGILFPVLVYLVIAGTTNAVNLTDGLDGLAAGSASFSFTAYVVIAFWAFRHVDVYHIPQALDLALVAASMVGACAGFLWWNAEPAQIIMGDAGALAIGAGLAAMALVTNTHLLLPVIGGIYVIETLSVIIQVASFRIFHRRVFRMAPIHHHFRLLGWPESTVIVRFWILAAMATAISVAIFYADYLSIPGIIN